MCYVCCCCCFCCCCATSTSTVLNELMVVFHTNDATAAATVVSILIDAFIPFSLWFVLVVFLRIVVGIEFESDQNHPDHGAEQSQTGQTGIRKCFVTKNVPRDGGHKGF